MPGLTAFGSPLPPRPTTAPFTEDVLVDGCFDRLLRLTAARPAPDRLQGPVLVVAPLSGIRPGLLFDMLASLAPLCDLHVLEWRDAGEVPAVCGGFGLSNCVARIMETVQDLGDGAHLLSLCQSALPALAATALLATSRTLPQPRSLTLIGGKIDPHANPTKGDRFAMDHSLAWFRDHAIDVVAPWRVGAGRPVYSEAAQKRVLMSYMGRHLMDGADIVAKALHDDGLDPIGHPFLPGVSALMDVPAEIFMDTIASVYHANALPRGDMAWFGLPVRPEAIRNTAILTIEGAMDDIASPGQSRVVHDLCPDIPADGHDHHLIPDTGHFSLFHGLPWRTEVLPRVERFLRLHG
ncbi:polyhydroxyalkanoate depolymerase [Nitrospirillum iridis]|uniref:Poly(3-hydroxybutyrate) depolymerase n=1 Tax=Nitrospirillum iridis TaxID=765888 RepID=A0A7X0B099_9PROT|nr:polyhydroxyalkanoate depolymerase [Nitrospirillum iridis]MBB6252977.1 poly(3-hydroxybutyrate) depolymerase [Nitrospirillum iridis]